MLSEKMYIITTAIYYIGAHPFIIVLHVDSVKSLLKETYGLPCGTC